MRLLPLQHHPADVAQLQRADLLMQLALLKRPPQWLLHSPEAVVHQAVVHQAVVVAVDF